MAAYESEQEQIEAIKKWWKENGASLLTGIIIGLTLLFGWRAWDTYTQQRAEAASTIYERMVIAIEKNEEKIIRETSTTLLSEYNNSPYATLASLSLARRDLESGNIDSSHAQLQWVIEYSQLPEFVAIARLRKVRLFLAQNKLSEAKMLLFSEPKLDKFKGTYEELRGDIALAEKKLTNARQAYKAALNTEVLSAEHRRLIQMKLDDVGEDGNSLIISTPPSFPELTAFNTEKAAAKEKAKLPETIQETPEIATTDENNTTSDVAEQVTQSKVEPVTTAEAPTEEVEATEGADTKEVSQPTITLEKLPEQVTATARPETEIKQPEPIIESSTEETPVSTSEIVTPSTPEPESVAISEEATSEVTPEVDSAPTDIVLPVQATKETSTDTEEVAPLNTEPVATSEETTSTKVSVQTEEAPVVAEITPEVVEPEIASTEMAENSSSETVQPAQIEEQTTQPEVATETMDVEKNLQLAQQYMKDQQYDEAKSLLEKTLQAVPETLPAMYQLAQLGFETQNYQEARKYLGKYVETMEHTPETLWLGIQIERGVATAKGGPTLEMTYKMLLQSLYPDSEQAKRLAYE